MVYKKYQKYQRSTGFYKDAKRWLGYAHDYATLPRRNQKNIVYIKKKVKLLNVEVKHFETSDSGNFTAIGSTPAPILLSSIAQGDSSVSRDGNSVKSIALEMRTTVNYNATANQNIRVLIVKSKFGENIQPEYTDILNNTANIQAFRNVDQSKGYKVLYDKILPMNDQIKQRVLKCHLKLSHHMKWDGSNGTDHTYGMLWAFLVTDNGTYPCDYNLYTRLRFVDN